MHPSIIDFIYFLRLPWEPNQDRLEAVGSSPLVRSRPGASARRADRHFGASAVPPVGSVEWGETTTTRHVP